MANIEITQIFLSYRVMQVHMSPKYRNQFWTPGGGHFGTRGQPMYDPSQNIEISAKSDMVHGQYKNKSPFSLLQGDASQYAP